MTALQGVVLGLMLGSTLTFLVFYFSENTR